MEFYSQVGQDRFLFEKLFHDKRDGVFVDIGAYDGVKFSNTLFFERHMGWLGLCIEPMPEAFAKLVEARKAVCEQTCVAGFDGEADFIECIAGIDEKMLSGMPSLFDARHAARVQSRATSQVTRKVPVTRLSVLLEKYALFDVDYCSIDTEGAELSILEDLDLDRFRIHAFTVEDNYNDERLLRVMNAKGYDMYARLSQDRVFVRRPT